MSQKILLLVITFSTIISYSQVITIVDSTDNKLVPYSAVKYENYKGFYADSSGYINLNNLVFDTLEIHNINYKTKIIPFSELTDTIKLTRVVHTLDEVVLTNRDFKKIKTLGLKKAKNCGSWPLFNHHKIITAFKPKTLYNTILIENLLMSFQNDLDFDKINLQFFIGEITEKNTDLNLIFLSEVLEEKHLTNPNVLSYSFIDKVEVSNQGFIFGLTFSTKTDEKIEIRPLLSTSKNKYFETETYVHYSFENNFEYFLINRCHKGNINYSLLVDFDISYE